MLAILMPLALIPLIAIGTISYVYGRDFLRQQAFRLLGTVAHTQGQRILEQVETGTLLLERLLDDQAFVSDLEAILKIEDRESAEFEPLRASLINQLQATNRSRPYFNQFMIVLPEEDTIHMATRSQWQNFRINFDQDFRELLAAAPASRAGFAPAFLYQDGDPAPGFQLDGHPIESFVIMTAIPFTNQAGEVQAYIVGLAESAVIRDFIENSAFYSEQAYFVTPQGHFLGLNPYSDNSNKLIFLPATQAHQDIFLSDLTSSPARAMELAASLQTHRQPVLAARTWLEPLQAAWTVEVLQSSVFGQIDALMRYALIVLGSLMTLIALALWLLTRSLTRPVLELAETVERFAGGNWQARSEIDRQDEVGLLADTFNHMADELTELYGQMESQVLATTGELHTLNRLSQIALNAADLDELLQKTLNLLVQRYDLIYAAVFLRDPSGLGDSEHAHLRLAAGNEEVMQRANVRRVRITAESTEALAGWVIATNRAQVRPLKNVRNGSEGNHAPAQYYEAAIPLATSELVLGAINLFAAPRGGNANGEPFVPRVVGELQSFANQIATATLKFQLIEASQTNMEEASRLYQAGHRIAQATDEETARQIAIEALKACSYRSAILLASDERLELIYSWQYGDSQMPASLGLAAIGSPFVGGLPQVAEDLSQSELPQELLDIPRQMGCHMAAFLPAMRGRQLAALLILGSASHLQGILLGTGGARRQAPFNTVALQPFANLIVLLAITIEKLQAQQDTQKRLVDLETLWRVSQTIAGKSDLRPLFQAIHQQIEGAMGRLDTIGIGLYEAHNDTIRFPYMSEEGEVITIPPIALGQGLTSIVLHTKQPLLLAEDTENKLRELGALTVGKQAKSWLGVPLLFGGEAIGILIVQDNQREGRFSAEDQRLLSTMAAQIAIAVRNARLLETTRSLAQQEKLANDISEKIRRAVDIQSILKTTADELGSALRLRRARLEIHAPEWGAGAASQAADISRQTETEKKGSGNGGRS
jgi:GAF domain-containing protein/HAMP domain-containing protein